MERIGEAVWSGGLKDGAGHISVESEILNHSYRFSSRFGEEGR